jgi:hypothetical protein
MKSRLFAIFLLTTTAAGAVLSAYLYLENRSLQTALKEANEEVLVPEMPPEARETIVPESVVQIVTLPVEPEVVAEVEPRPQFSNRADRFRQMMADPNFQNAMLERSKSRIERNYAGLLRTLDLDEETVGIFMTLLAERSNFESQAAFQWRAGRNDPEAVIEVEFMLEENLAQIDRSLAEVLGDEKYGAYDYYQSTLPQRQSVGELARKLSYSGTPLTEDRAEVLVGVMAAAGESLPYTTDLAQLSPRDRSTVTQDDLAVYIDERRTLNEIILSEASLVLEEDQLEALADQQIREVEQLERRSDLSQQDRPRFGRTTWRVSPE